MLITLIKTNSMYEQVCINYALILTSSQDLILLSNFYFDIIIIFTLISYNIISILFHFILHFTLYFRFLFALFYITE